MRKAQRGALAAVVLLCSAVLGSAGFIPPAFAIPAGNGCNASGVPAAMISWYPAQPQAQSALKMACTFNNNTGTSQVSASFTLHDTNGALWHNGAARSVTNTAATIAAGATTITFSSCAGITAYVNRPITRVPIVEPPLPDTVVLQDRTFIKSITAGCVATLNLPTVATAGPGADIPIPGSSTFKIDNSAARQVVDGVTNGTNLVTSATANFVAATDDGGDGFGGVQGLSISGTGIAANCFIDHVASATSVHLTTGCAPAAGTAQQLTFGDTLVSTTARQVTGASTTSTVRINSTVAGWSATDIGLKVVGVCDQTTAATGDDYTIPANTYITATPSAVNADTTGGLTTGQTGCNLTIGDSSVSASANGDVAAHQGVQADLNPALIGGAGACADEQPEGFGTVAKWYNPGSFQGVGVTSLQPGTAASFQPTFPTKAIGQLFFDTSIGDASAFVLEKRALSTTPTGAADPIGVVHYDVIFPFLPTTLGMCPGTASSPGLGLSLNTVAITASQLQLPDTGRPGTGQLRSILYFASGGYTSTAYVVSDNPAITFSPASAFNRLCIYPTGLPNPANFQCGPG